MDLKINYFLGRLLVHCLLKIIYLFFWPDFVAVQGFLLVSFLLVGEYSSRAVFQVALAPGLSCSTSWDLSCWLKDLILSLHHRRSSLIVHWPEVQCVLPYVQHRWSEVINCFYVLVVTFEVDLLGALVLRCLKSISIDYDGSFFPRWPVYLWLFSIWWHRPFFSSETFSCCFFDHFLCLFPASPFCNLGWSQLTPNNTPWNNFFLPSLGTLPEAGGH